MQSTILFTPKPTPTAFCGAAPTAKPGILVPPQPSLPVMSSKADNTKAKEAQP